MNQHTHAAKIFVGALNNGSRPSNNFPNPHAPPAYTTHPTVDASDYMPAPNLLESDSGSTCEGHSAINFNIRTPLHIVGNGNLVALSPPMLAASIAERVMKQIKVTSMSDGIPMIDENGRPRPIEVVVEAGVDVRGNGNVVGEREVLGVVARNMRRSSATGVTNLAANAGGASTSASTSASASASANTITATGPRAKRAASEPLGEPAAKKERTA